MSDAVISGGSRSLFDTRKLLLPKGQTPCSNALSGPAGLGG
ncbi:hypothetical protein PXO_05822 [Xanthomonas oryzae pv. oryzae PXO99A]|uniref:Uncharacterized protein n=1 Tax=Xanthomonas oryzae pv. oryzae (strain PXO99A) TaxID=360094 RepID=A0A0K0GIU6_XANOP|nr:hypothetical protein PXO_05822 [Xanthomonas oryzae pv. oryzae PXO99A]